MELIVIILFGIAIYKWGVWGMIGAFILLAAFEYLHFSMVSQHFNPNKWFGGAPDEDQ